MYEPPHGEPGHFYGHDPTPEAAEESLPVPAATKLDYRVSLRGVQVLKQITVRDAVGVPCGAAGFRDQCES